MSQGFEDLVKIAEWQRKLEDEIEIMELELRLNKLKGKLQENHAENAKRVELARKALDKISYPYTHFPI